MKLFDIAAKTHAKPMQTELGVKWAGTCPACDAKNGLHITQINGEVALVCIWCNLADDELLAPLETTLDDVEVLEDDLEVESQKALRSMLAREEAKTRLVRMQAIEEVSAIQSVSAKDLLREEIPDVPYRVDRLWPVGGNVVLSAQAKAGKSTLAMNLTRALVTGQRFLGEFETSKPTGKIAIIDLELSRSHLQSWLGSIGVDTEQVVVYPMRGRASAIAKALDCDPEPKALQQAVQNATPEQLAEIKRADNDFAVQMKKLDVDVFALQTADTQDARKRFSGDWTARLIAIMCVLFFGSYIFMVTIQEPNQNSDAVINLVLGYLGGIVSSIISFYFGASSKDQTSNE